MKIRTGFVSNSSSSSFVLAVKEEHHRAVVNEFSEAEKKYFDETTELRTAFGFPVRVYTIVSVHGDSNWDDEKYDLAEAYKEEMLNDPDWIEENTDEDDEQSLEDFAYDCAWDNCSDLIPRWRKAIQNKFGNDAYFSSRGEF